jgi:hypothetical protein
VVALQTPNKEALTMTPTPSDAHGASGDLAASIRMIRDAALQIIKIRNMLDYLSASHGDTVRLIPPDMFDVMADALSDALSQIDDELTELENGGEQ